MLLLGLMIGLGAAAFTFPADFLLPRAGAGWAPVGDAAQHAIAQRYFLHAPWAWPPLQIPDLDVPRGTMLAFVDGIPLQAMALKLAAGQLPDGFHGIGLWYAITHALQPMAAIWALRGAGERRLWPALGVGLAAAAMPAWLARYGHAALTGHFLILLALGLYLRLVRRQGLPGWLAAIVIAVAALLVHPYLAAMVLAILGAVPLSLVLRGGRGWVGAACGLAAAAGAVLGVMAAFGYLGAGGDGGYGQFAMNLLSPFWPYRSLLLPGLASAEIDATGKGGWEGYNWLGAGLLVAVVACLMLAPRDTVGALRRHAGLVIVLAGLSALAVSHRVGLGTTVVLEIGPVPGLLEQFRASGRFFWPVAYGLLVGSFALLGRLRPGGAMLVLGLGVLQLADTLPIRADLRAWAATRQAWTLDAAALRPLLAEASQLTILPSWPCIPRDAGETHRQVLEAMLLASERVLPVSTTHSARWRDPPRCGDDALAAAAFRPGELRLILPAALPAALPLVPDAEGRCRMVGVAMACVDPPLPAPPEALPRQDSPPQQMPPVPADDAPDPTEPSGPSDR